MYSLGGIKDRTGSDLFLFEVLMQDYDKVKRLPVHYIRQVLSLVELCHFILE